MTDKQYQTFRDKITLRQANEIIKHGRYSKVQIPNKEYADVIYNQIKREMDAESKITGKKNTNYMRTFINRVFKPESHDFINRKQYLASKSDKASQLKEIYKLDSDIINRIIDLNPPTKSDVRYNTKNYSEFWNNVESLQKELRKNGKSWNQINEIIGTTYFGKEY